ncbi:ATP-binding protein [Rubripirellula reticaptiva]|uniref:histidine kinase n=1 Tax=Rubripirellula reticaptiva TaxID=2528013 RepID=A0A5C6EQJ8_9BACT|nr:ATP-binding protein [Rubripirellula reticaptiva]TWU49841.1 Alkaline phosphatase synthesis sensor protein PhoR [Rubripirellula reticaptiva]
MPKSERLAWPILLLLMTVLVPSAGVVWMMREAVRNERLASNQRLREAYQIQLEAAGQAVRERWSSHASASQALSQNNDARSPARLFADLVSRGGLDSVLITDGQGDILYPDPPRSLRRRTESIDPLWLQAEKLEFTDRLFAEAAQAYTELAARSDDAVVSARARQAQVRCLIAANDNAAAIEVLQSQRTYSALYDADGRSLAAAAELRLLEIMPPQTAAWVEVRESLHQRLGNYDDVTMTSAQRRFLMNQLPQFTDQPIDWPMQDAEVLAAQAAATKGITQADASLQPTSLPGLWARASSDDRLIELYRTATLRKTLLQLTDGSLLPSGVAFAVTAPTETSDHLMDTSLGDDMGRWRLGLAMTGGDPFDDVSKQRRAVHLWIGLLVIAVTCVLAWLLATSLRQRLRLAQLKNDLVATVSHELKTPLASTRLLVDTLLSADENDDSQANAKQTREYLQLISHENARLTRLIDNFLTFSRMDQDKAILDFRTVDVGDLVNQAVTVFRERSGIDDDSLQVDEVPELSVSGDLDSLVTAVVNLLENAWKYSEDPRKITVTTDADQQHVRLAVRDNGIGMSAREIDRAFDRFYQVDQRVSRTRGGCGLGLGIVKAIAQSHGGSVRVESELGVGSRFTVCLPKLMTRTE